MNRIRRLLKRQPIFWACILGAELLIAMQAEFVLGQAALEFPRVPAPQIHPLPAALAQWQDSENQGDYFDAIQLTPVGYLIWSGFPVQVYVQPTEPTDQTGRSQAWYEAVNQALQEWTIYLPLQLVATPETANIIILRAAPPIQRPDPNASVQSPLDRLPRIRSAETRYEIFVDNSGEVATLSHRFMIHLSPSQTADYTKATARHELGHALGLWGHSQLQTDALYFSQVRTPPTISHRDINTLKRIYQQPTRLGWTIPR